MNIAEGHGGSSSSSVPDVESSDDEQPRSGPDDEPHNDPPLQQDELLTVDEPRLEISTDDKAVNTDDGFESREVLLKHIAEQEQLLMLVKQELGEKMKMCSAPVGLIATKNFTVLCPL